MKYVLHILSNDENVLIDTMGFDSFQEAAGYAKKLLENADYTFELFKSVDINFDDYVKTIVSENDLKKGTK